MLGLFADAGVGVKVVSVLVAACVMAVAVGAVGLTRLAALDSTAQDLSSRHVAGIRQLGNLRELHYKTRLDITSYLVDSLRGNPPAKWATALAQDDEKMAAATTAYLALAPDQATAITAFTATWTAYKAGRDRLRAAADRHDLAGYIAVRNTYVTPVSTVAAAQLGAMSAAEAVAAAAAAVDARNVYRTGRDLVAAILLGGVVLTVALAVVVVRAIVRPVRQVSAVLAGFARGDLTGTADVRSADEIGQMAQSLTAAGRYLRRVIATVTAEAEHLSGASSSLLTLSAQLDASAEATSARAGGASVAAEEVSRNVQTVAAGTEEMDASIREIAQNATEAATITVEAVAVATQATATIGKLQESSERIDTVVAMITTIAAQTNLLALNATIEAARAGDSGKGFAVVAGEVKDLAQETAKATEDIAHQVEAIKAGTAAAVAAISQISTVTSKINTYQTAIASAVEEQSATTEEMARNVSEAAVSTDAIAHNITGVATAAQATAAGIAGSRTAATDLARLSSELRELVADITY